MLSLRNPLKLFLLLFCSFVCYVSFCQRPVKPVAKDLLSQLFNPQSGICGDDQMLYRLREDAAFRLSEQKMNDAIRKAQSAGTNGADTVVTLPVVVHIINDTPSAITDQQVISGISLLNDAFGKTGVYAASKGVDTKIRFCIAHKDPDGGNTTGITRTTSFFANHMSKDIEDDRLKNLIHWDPSRYINIWLVSSIQGEALVSYNCGIWQRFGVGGYATIPPASPAVDGVVITGFGSLLVHEMGHYLGLYHPFQGGCYNNDCTLDGDLVCDTPPEYLPISINSTCANPSNSCSTDTISGFTIDMPDLRADFMDYSGCQSEFTQGQADRMRATITTQRSGLLQNECTQPCPDEITAGFTRDVAYPVTGTTVNFTNTSTGASHFQWFVNGTVVSTATNFSYTFNTAGKAKVTLEAFNTPGCFAAYTDYVITNCGVTARFYSDSQTIASKIGVFTSGIVFINTSHGGVSFKWLIANDSGMAETVVSNAPDLSYVFPAPANYTVRLVATNGTCTDTTEYYPITVIEPTAPAATRAKSVMLCEGDSLALPWGPIVKAGGTYADTLHSNAGCDSLIYTVRVVLQPKPVVSISKSNDVDCIIGIAHLTATGGSNYQWSPAASLNSPNIYNPVAAPVATTTYHVMVTSGYGCTQQDSIEVKVLAGEVANGYHLPSAFTPNKDGVDDCFGVLTWGAVTNLNFAVYNRFGNIVFETVDPAKCWDGTFQGVPQPLGTYVYMVTAQTTCGKVFRKGTIELIR